MTQDAFQPPTRILVVDDHPLVRDGLVAILQTQRDMEVVGEVEDGEQAVLRYRELQPDIVLMDLQMPRMGGIEAIVRICKLDPSARIVVLTTYKGDVQAVKALEAGACAYLLKSVLRRELVETIREIRFDRLWRKRLPQEIAADVAAHVLDDALSRREAEVLGLISGGNSNKAIAALMGISEDTVKAHVKSILRKLNARDRTHAVTLGLRRGIIEL
ncbi:two-component system, NarL family, response regulator [Pseudoxanthomonas sp. GM95]|uniref:response regulator transcription factor n=1 Tax=Pseudoxanthomonas sp. GM95 TaxID=1881043 RepID=UPI0008C6917B|nr:response regulator transcription factor [Pseudoxanthomonas sp. GM95]SEL10009.1 two-component system, NarL family, response regulator [Pseudoxanthomonas sp. GM95]